MFNIVFVAVVYQCSVFFIKRESQTLSVDRHIGPKAVKRPPSRIKYALFTVLSNRIENESWAASQRVPVVNNMSKFHCCVPNCVSDSRYDANKELSFHRFPQDSLSRKSWVIKIRRDVVPHFQVRKSRVKICCHGLDPCH